MEHSTGTYLSQPLEVEEVDPPGTKASAFLRWLWQHKLTSTLTGILIFLVAEYLSLPSNSAIERLRKQNPKVTAIMEQRIAETREKGRKLRVRQVWVNFQSISQDLIHSVIVAEDGTFYEHGGIDWFEIQESIEKNIKEGEVARGASTITQQLAKNLFLSTSRDPVRKLKEFIITMRLEKALSKDRILEIYLNAIEWGDGIFGVEAASEHYFRKHASELSRDEAARLAAVLPNPRMLRANSGSRSVLWRRDVVLERLEARGW